MKITIYSTSICAACETLEHWLDKVGQTYEKKITDLDPAVMAEFMSVNDGIVSVPFSVVTADDGRTTKIAGFDQQKFKETLSL